MSTSVRYQELLARAQELREHLLPKAFDPTGIYSDIDQDMARGYRLLMHAEIEAYLEDMARQAVLEKITQWKKTRTASNLLLAFLACYHSGWHEYNETSYHEFVRLSKERQKPFKAIE